jgi:cytochrome c biogenesis protein CcmG/thiol:disulfide interchange protein DsbE
LSAHLKAIFGVLVTLCILGAVFFFFNRPAKVVEGPSVVDRVEKMKLEGVPLFTSHDLAGHEFNLESQKGKTLIVNFWASWCEPCVEEVPSLIALIKKLDGKVELIAVSGDSDKVEIESFLKSFPELRGPHISILWDQDKSIVQNYGVERLPETFIVGPDLKLIKKVVGSVHWDQPDSVNYFEQLVSGK